MAELRNLNLDLLELAVKKLGDLTDKLVFLGGCATGLLLTDKAAPPVRATGDVDVVTEVASYPKYQQLAEQLRKKGFKEDLSSDAPICRWSGFGILLDVMPTDPSILGFGSKWYLPALRTAKSIELPSGTHIQMVTVSYFLATKLAAFDDRGCGDYLGSHDLEDIVAVLDGRPGIADEVRQSDKELRTYLTTQFQSLLANRDFLEALPGHLPGDSASQARLPFVIEQIQLIIDAGSE